MRLRAARTRSCPCRSSALRGRRPARCNACTRSRRSPARGARSPAARAPRCRRRRRRRSSRRAGSPARARGARPSRASRVAARVGDCSRRMPVIQPSRSGERVPERADLADRAAEGGVARPERVAVDRGLAAEGRALVDLDLDPVALLDLPPDVVGLGEQHVGVEREDARVGSDRRAACRAAPTPPSGRSTRARASGGSARPSLRAPRAPQASLDRRRRRGPGCPSPSAENSTRR